MKILLIGNFPGDRQESMVRFAEMLRAGFTDRGHEVSVLTPTARIARIAGAYRYAGVPKYLGYLDKFVLFPRRLRRELARRPVDVVHIVDQANAGYADATRGTPTLATCHDLLQIRAARGEFPQQSVGRFGRAYQAWILKSVGRLPHAACISEKTRRDVLQLTALDESRVSCVPNALNYPYRPVEAATAGARLEPLLRENGLEPRRFAREGGGFLLNVGGGHWYKNRPGLLAIYAELRRVLPSCPRLLLVGPPLSPEDSARAAALGLLHEIFILKGVSNAVLEALYSACEGMIFPSLEEGFGWPIAEAQACGGVVFTSDREPMNEVGGAAAVYFDPADPAAAARRIAAAWDSRSQRREAGIAATGRWAPALMLAAYENVYAGLGVRP